MAFDKWHRDSPCDSPDLSRCSPFYDRIILSAKEFNAVCQEHIARPIAVLNVLLLEVRTDLPESFGVCAGLTPSQTSISAWLLAQYAHQDRFPSVGTRDGLRIALFAACWTLSGAGIQMFLLLRPPQWVRKHSITAVAGQTVWAILTWAVWVAATRTIQRASPVLSAKMNCAGADYCTQLHAAFASLCVIGDIDPSDRSSHSGLVNVENNALRTKTASESVSMSNGILFLLKWSNSFQNAFFVDVGVCSLSSFSWRLVGCSGLRGSTSIPPSTRTGGDQGTVPLEYPWTARSSNSQVCLLIMSRFLELSNVNSVLTERMNLANDPSVYASDGARLLEFIALRERVAAASGRFAYGKLEYPFTLPIVSPDKITPSSPFPPGRFHQDMFSGNPNITKFYVTTLVPFFNSSTSYFYHLDNSTWNLDAVFNLDATLLALLSHRAHIGKVVAETKYASNVTGFTQLIKARDADGIRTLVTNTTQEAGVLAQAATAVSAFTEAWVSSGALVPDTFGSTLQQAAAVLFRELIDITTEIEIQYVSNLGLFEAAF
ncbi:hypothetical protein NM688_g565 [Phlebia brevispora]|uniref:Uncharacterized protein n=1 Tax=Phlebia brevispora TaxID=194682 RepID=A0ACC1TDV6_9APHY|nr:hypothetical protein NM688_g565 [Phlebia brevispora]